MKHEKTIILRVTDWPRFSRTTTFTLDEKIFANEASLREHVEKRFGEGVLRRTGERSWEYRRRLPGPRFVWNLLALVLNRSYD